MKQWSLELCDDIISRYGAETGFFDGSYFMIDMYDLLRDRMGLGLAETDVILAALIKAGAQFKSNR